MQSENNCTPWVRKYLLLPCLSPPHPPLPYLPPFLTLSVSRISPPASDFPVNPGPAGHLLEKGQPCDITALWQLSESQPRRGMGSACWLGLVSIPTPTPGWPARPASQRPLCSATQRQDDGKRVSEEAGI